MAAHKSIFYHLERDPHRVQAGERSSPGACMGFFRRLRKAIDELVYGKTGKWVCLDCRPTRIRALISRFPTVRPEILNPIQLFSVGFFIYAGLFKDYRGMDAEELTAWTAAVIVAISVAFLSHFIQEDREDRWRAQDEELANLQARIGERWTDRAIRRAYKRRGLL